MKRGFFVGFGLTVWRILRCNPYGKGGYDPVPPKRLPKYARERRQETTASFLKAKEEKSNDTDRSD